MSRKKKLLLNTATSLASQAIAVVCGLILPRYLLLYFGSSTNGLVASITQFLGFISLCELGVGAVVQSALYQPLANKDDEQLSKIIKSSEKFFKTIAYILVAYVLVLVLVYPRVVSNQFDYVYSASLILIIAFNSFAQYYFGITYKLLLSADQMSYIQLGMNCVILILNTVICVLMMKAGASIHLVKAASVAIHLIQPFYLRQYALKHYNIDKNIKYTVEPIKQKWNGMAQHVAYVVLKNTDIVVLTLFSSLNNVSIYSVYYLVVNGVQQFITAATTGFQSLLGNMLARKEFDMLSKAFDSIEWLFHYLATIVFTITGIMVIPFVQLYTSGVNDANYIVPSFAILLTVSQAIYSLRQPYKLIIKAAGHYRETQISSIIEALLNVIVSVILVFKYGIIGVAIGTLVAMSYMTIYYIIYLSQNIINRSAFIFTKKVLVDILCVCGIIMTCKLLHLEASVNNYIEWLIMAIEVGIICLLETSIINYIFFNKTIKLMLRIVKKK